MSAAGTRLVSFKFGDKFKKIAVTPSHEYDAIVRQVAEALGVEAVEIEYEDPADGQIYILSAEEDMSEAFSQNYRWQVADISATTAPSVTSARFPEAGTSGQGDEFNHEGIPPERGDATLLTFTGMESVNAMYMQECGALLFPKIGNAKAESGTIRFS
ncbi:hypothetical protein DFJ73DRAFT_758507 [Zopfochytrium polystomum]|nr:hypothetical protein DFJ73DRAFT_758507 [Zopfochytrium polystomum]